MKVKFVSDPRFFPGRVAAFMTRRLSLALRIAS